ncbi:hypothetical protein GA0070606_5373 [Micromonospora citrea]|uniref:Uncharacterized protein n=1 Tax=Micromonospora citrea TaxID=47855 RepID=A0A1C6VWT2_9ACTN|nr:hypothetical protein GA0070606_5373 [Micromonospora citrea]
MSGRLPRSTKVIAAVYLVVIVGGLIAGCIGHWPF